MPALPIDSAVSRSADGLRKSRERLTKAEVRVGEYERVDPRSGRTVHVSSYTRSVVDRLVSRLESLGEGGSVDLPGGLGTVRHRTGEDGGYLAVSADGMGRGTYPTVLDAVDAIAYANGGGRRSHHGTKITRGNRLHPKETVIDRPEGKSKKKKGLLGRLRGR